MRRSTRSVTGNVHEVVLRFCAGGCLYIVTNRLAATRGLSKRMKPKRAPQKRVRLLTRDV
jgi:uncharacterized protein YutD